MKHLKRVFILVFSFLIILSINQAFIAEEWLEKSVLEQFVSKTLQEMVNNENLEKYPWARYSLERG